MPVPRADELLRASTPALRVTVPEKVLAELSVSVPELVLVKPDGVAAGSETVPLRVRFRPLPTSKMPLVLPSRRPSVPVEMPASVRFAEPVTRMSVLATALIVAPLSCTRPATVDELLLMVTVFVDVLLMSIPPRISPTPPAAFNVFMLIPGLTLFPVPVVKISVDSPLEPVKVAFGALPAMVPLGDQFVAVSHAVLLAEDQVRIAWAVAGVEKQAAITHTAAAKPVLPHRIERMAFFPSWTPDPLELHANSVPGVAKMSSC